MNQQITWQAELALKQRGFAFVEFEIVNPGPKQRVVAKATKGINRAEALGHTAFDAEQKLVRLVRAN